MVRLKQIGLCTRVSVFSSVVQGGLCQDAKTSCRLASGPGSFLASCSCIIVSNTEMNIVRCYFLSAMRVTVHVGDSKMSVDSP